MGDGCKLQLSVLQRLRDTLSSALSVEVSAFPARVLNSALKVARLLNHKIRHHK